MKTSKSIRIILWILSLLVCLTAIPAYAETYYCTAKSGLNCRWEPNRKAKVETILAYGDSVEVLAIDDGWANVWAGDSLWCCLDYLSLTPPTDEPQQGVIDADGRVALRETPDGKRVGWLKPGAEVEILGTLDGWVRTAKGYIAAEYVAPSEDF